MFQVLIRKSSFESIMSLHEYCSAVNITLTHRIHVSDVNLPCFVLDWSPISQGYSQQGDMSLKEYQSFF